MTASNFDRCIKLILASEGGNDDDPDDRGGRTSRGITQREYDAYRATHPGLPSDVWKAPQSAIINCYRISYWDPWCDIWKSGTDYIFFDIKILHGPGKANPWLQRALAKPEVKVDGHIGIVTRTFEALSDPRDIITRMTALRRAHFRAIVASRSSQRKFLRGWLARADRVEVDALKMV